MCHGQRRDDPDGGAARALRRARCARRAPGGGARAGPRAARARRRRGRHRQDGARAALLRARRRGRVLWGACDALLHPAPARPVRRHRRRAWAASSAPPWPRARRRARSSRRWPRSLRGRPPGVVVLEDLHWADEATLDVLRLLARRIESLPALVLATYRDDELDRAHPLRIVLGELPSALGRALALAPLSAAGGRRARRLGRASTTRELHRAHRRQPVLRDRGPRRGATTRSPPPCATPCSPAPRGSTRGRGRCSTPSRSCRRAPSCGCSRRSPRASSTASTRAWPRACCAPSATRSSFRHEIARVAVEEALAPAPARRAAPPRARGARGGRGARRTSPASPTTPRRPTTPTPCCATPRPPASARRRSGPIARRRRSSPARCATPTACRRERRAELLERRSYECYLTDDIAERHRGAPASARRAPRGRRPRSREGDAHRWLSRLVWFDGDNAMAEREARRAVELLEPLAPGPRARDGLQQHGAAAHAGQRPAGRDALGRAGDRARRAAGRDRDRRPRAQQRRHRRADARGRRTGARSSSAASRWRSRPASRSTSPARTRTSARARSSTRATRSAIAISRPASRYCASTTSTCGSLHGRMAGALRARPGALGRRRRHGHGRAGGARHPGADAHHPAHRARPPARAPGRPRSMGAARRGARARARHGRGAAPRRRWPPPAPRRAGSPARARRSRPRPTPALALEQSHRWAGGELFSGAVARASSTTVRRDLVAEPFRLELAGDYEGAAERWTAMGCPYEAALARGHADDDAAQRRGLAELQRLGAHPAARRVARGLRERGLRDVSRGPAGRDPREPRRADGARARGRSRSWPRGCATRRSPGGCSSPRRRSPTTSRPILRKLGVATRSQAGAEAARLGIVER